MTDLDVYNAFKEVCASDEEGIAATIDVVVHLRSRGIDVTWQEVRAAAYRLIDMSLLVSRKYIACYVTTNNLLAEMALAGRD